MSTGAIAGIIIAIVVVVAIVAVASMQLRRTRMRPSAGTGLTGRPRTSPTR